MTETGNVLPCVCSVCNYLHVLQDFRTTLHPQFRAGMLSFLPDVGRVGHFDVIFLRRLFLVPYVASKVLLAAPMLKNGCEMREGGKNRKKVTLPQYRLIYLLCVMAHALYLKVRTRASLEISDK